jgi:hypothetical protein
MLDSIRTLLHGVLTSPRGDWLAPIRVPKRAAREINDLFGAPLCSRAELERRRAEAERRRARIISPPGRVTREPVPVLLYVEKDRNAREVTKIRDVLGAHGIVPKVLDVTGDEATFAFVLREAKCERDELPVVFVGSAVIGGFRELVAFDTSGQLKKAVFGG